MPRSHQAFGGSCWTMPKGLKSRSRTSSARLSRSTSRSRTTRCIRSRPPPPLSRGSIRVSCPEGWVMDSALAVHRLHFAFTITFHYIFPQLTMGLALLLVYLKTKALRTGDEHYNRAARFWAKIFGINFALGVVTGIPMEFQFGTNWAQFSRLTGGVIGQPLAMEGTFSFFLESAFLGLFLYGEKRLGKWGHWGAGFLVFLGSWISGFFIIVADAWMQHPVAYTRLP